MAKKRFGEPAEPQDGGDLIADFISRYRKEYDFYEQACRMAAQLLDTNLQSAGVRAIVTSRAKNPVRLETKVRQRASTRKVESIDQLYEDIVDLAGIRVALYFPAEREATGRIITSLFAMVEEPKDFPSSAKPQPASYEKRFSGYWATHYRVRIRDEQLNESQKRYLDAKFEIQVASVLMHAWSEVEHDLVYKPLQGQLSEEEYSILDELNGMILVGEIALERLQRAGEARVSRNHYYTNHYDLATSLLELARQQPKMPELHDALIGRVDLLFELLKQLERNTPEDVSAYVKALHNDFERRPIAEQVIDQILAEDPKRYEIFNALRTNDGAIGQDEAPEKMIKTAIANFLMKYAHFEQLLKKYYQISPAEYKSIQWLRPNGDIVNIPPAFVDAFTRVRRFRNDLVHGVVAPELFLIAEHQQELQGLIGEIDQLEK